MRARACLCGAALRLVGPSEAAVLLDNVGKKCRANAYRVADIVGKCCYFETVPIMGRILYTDARKCCPSSASSFQVWKSLLMYDLW